MEHLMVEQCNNLDGTVDYYFDGGTVAQRSWNSRTEMAKK